MRWIKTEKNEGDQRIIRAWFGDSEGEGHIKRSDLSDKGARLNGYKDAVSLIVEDRFATPELGEDGEKKLMSVLTQLTGLSNMSKSEWAVWLKRNKDKLFLYNDKLAVPKEG